MGIRINWTDTNTAEDGYNVYRHTASMLGLTDAQLAAYLIAERPADATEHEDGTAVDGTTYYYLVAAKVGSSLIRGQEVEAVAASGPDYANAQIGDEIGGGIYAGIITVNGADHHYVVSLASGEATGLIWGNFLTETNTGNQDGMVSQQAILANWTSDEPPEIFYYARDYRGGGYDDWYIPSTYELSSVDGRLGSHPELAANRASVKFTWTSLESNDRYAYGRRLYDGNQSNTRAKDSTDLLTRPIRKIPV